MTRAQAPKVIVITGASSGVGRASAVAFARHGAHIGLLARGHDGLEGARHDVEAAGGKALALPADVADPGQVDAAAAAVEETFGPIDIWINNAMVTVFAPVKEMKPAEYRRVTEITYLGYVYGTLAALRSMLKRDSGTIIQIGSALVYRSIPLQSAYCASKAAIRGFTDSLRTELIHDASHIKVCMLQLPAINTPQSLRQRNKMPHQPQPVPPMFNPEDIADIIVGAARNPPRELLIGWPTVRAIWGQKFFPGLLDRVAAHLWQQQMIDKPNQQQGDILWDGLPGDPGPHGPYRDKEQRPDLQMQLLKRLLR